MLVAAALALLSVTFTIAQDDTVAVDPDTAATIMVSPVTDLPDVTRPFTFRSVPGDVLMGLAMSMMPQGFGALDSDPLTIEDLIAMLPGYEVEANAELDLPETAAGTQVVFIDAPPPGLAVSAIDCLDGSGTPVGQAELAGQDTPSGVQLELAAGDAITCTFTIAQDDTVAVDPDTAATIAPIQSVPREGRWQVANGVGRIDCGRFSQRIPTARSDSGRITVRRGGDRLILRGAAEGADRPITVDRTARDPARYFGSLGMRLQGIQADFTLTLNVRSEERIDGKMSATARVEGTRCTISQPFGLIYAGDS